MLGKKIKELRLISGLTQEDVALKTGLTQRTIQRIENHEVEPSEYSLNQIGEVFKVNLNKMKLDEKNKKNDPNPRGYPGHQTKIPTIGN